MPHIVCGSARSPKVFCFLHVCVTTNSKQVGLCWCFHLEQLLRAEGLVKWLCSCESHVWISRSVLSPHLFLSSAVSWPSSERAAGATYLLGAKMQTLRSWLGSVRVAQKWCQMCVQVVLPTKEMVIPWSHCWHTTAAGPAEAVCFAAFPALLARSNQLEGDKQARSHLLLAVTVSSLPLCHTQSGLSSCFLLYSK